MENKIYVTQPYLPPLEDFLPYLEEIWDNKWLTNNGPLHQRLELALADYLNVPFVSLFANGTLALMTAMQALNIEGEVITTPFTFVATSHALVWNKLKPVFVDVDSVYGNLDPDRIEEAITEKTKAILPVHVYGNPCDHVRIKKIADKHGLSLIYDAAHAFGVKLDDNSILNYGDLSVLSFHATKVFNTFEGGAIISHTLEMKQHIDDLKNFGFRGETLVVLAGMNAKMSEVHAAMGLLQLKTIDESLEARKQVAQFYVQSLKGVKGIRYMEPRMNQTPNFAYFPIFVEEEYPISRDKLYSWLKENGVFVRRYFYPLLTNMEVYHNGVSEIRGELINAETLSNQVICLPMYGGLALREVERIAQIIGSINIDREKD